MKSIVWKQTIAIDDRDHKIMMPRFSMIVFMIRNEGTSISFHHVFNEPWKEATEERFYRVFGTGMETPNGYEYRASCQDGPFIWHLFENCAKLEPTT